MRSAALWRRACGAAPRWGNGGIAPGPPKSLQAVEKPFLKEAVRRAQRQHQQLQPATRWSWTASAAVAENGAAAGFPSRVQQAHFASSAVPDPDVAAVVDGDERLLHVLRCEVEDLAKRSLVSHLLFPPRLFVCELSGVAAYWTVLCTVLTFGHNLVLSRSEFVTVSFRIIRLW